MPDNLQFLIDNPQYSRLYLQLISIPKIAYVLVFFISLKKEKRDDGMKEQDYKTKDTNNRTLTPWFFQHQELITVKDADRTWEQKKLINKLNYINFSDGYVYFLFGHTATDEQILIKVYPQPCVKNELTCRLDLSDALVDLTIDKLNYLFIDDGVITILAPITLIGRQDNLLIVTLPDKSQIRAKRKTKRFICDDITCKVVQGDFIAHGTLIDFSPSGLGIKLTGNENLKGFDESKSALIKLTREGARIFSGLCRCSRNGMNSPDSRVIFAPLNEQASLFPKRDIRNNRQHIEPSFTANFKHPLFNGYVERDIFDISPAGFSIRDKIDEETLLPGMIIPNIVIVYAGIVKMKCSAQVVYRQEDQDNIMIKCGLAIADMDLQSFTQLNHILGVYNDNYARISSEVEMDSLWEFFFDTGFIYGEKYEYIQSHREAFKETYRKLYQDNPDIARHIVYKKNGRIYGHIAMVHAYEPSWVIHHFAARRMSHRLPGIAVLKQITQYVSSYNRLPTAGMDHVMTYYQPNNDIIDRIFGNFTRYLKDLRGSSLDVFSYLLYEKNTTLRELPADWKLRQCSIADLVKLREFYEFSSGGLLLSALGLEIPSESIKKSFARAGFKRDYSTYCLCHEDKQTAFFVVNQSDIKLNLSDLINGIKIIVSEPDNLSWEILSTAVNCLADLYPEKNIPLLVYPSRYLASLNIPEEKQYTLWILQLRRSSDDYLAYMNKLMKLKSGRE
jgi:hypothetical protein